MLNKRNGFTLFFLLVAAAITVSAFSQPDPEWVHGSLKAGVEQGCWLLDSDDGRSLDLKGDLVAAIPKEEGLPLTLKGRLRPDWAGICLEGEIFEVLGFYPDRQVSSVLVVGVYSGANLSWWRIEDSDGFFWARTEHWDLPDIGSLSVPVLGDLDGNETLLYQGLSRVPIKSLDST